MSVAFRRESDEEHLEPKFELPIPPGPNLVTEGGLAQILERVAELETTLTQLTDEEAIKSTRRDLRYWSTRQSTAQIPGEPTGASVAFGCTVTFRIKGKQQCLTIVGHDEADPAAGLISFSAPLSRAMMGAEIGDRLDFAGRPEEIEILAIEVNSTPVESSAEREVGEKEKK
ncbi:nucleoside-diphosphate kinase [Altererythrobacter xixiisoli]|uniref:Nucleoside-diphosphate kinase n=1 Tax=Croceibacterium xixiisoli TaxID=1476466 RepID=A0A6I4TWJ7_9SPHN|nr:GreA/GreB family elongation factor [Croceibacterium xixiisoli]MXP00556.1 nucleoside-diphosphate kinase [Croceibacterium xixiisoli]